MKLRLLALIALLCGICRAEDASVHVGTLKESTPGHLLLERSFGLVSVGYFADEPVQRDVATLELGTEVRAVFAVANVPGDSIRQGNKLIHIRRCADRDEECDADRRREVDAEAARRAKADLLEREQARCFKAMRATLRRDRRHVRGPDDEPSDELDDRFAALAGEQEQCANAIVQAHRDAYYEACERHQCGEHNAGGCEHRADRAINSAVVRRAVDVCADP